ITRNGSTLTTVGAVTGYVDANAAPATTYTYTVLAQDAAGNTSPTSNPTTVTTPSAPDTLIDSGPTPVTNSNSATFAFHSTAAGATFICKLDGGKANNCTSPRSYTGLSSGSHSFSVFSTANGISDPTPATATWTIDLIAPSVPSGLVATKAPASVTLNWTASTDNVAVVGYEIFRGGTPLASVGNVVVYIDSTV